MDSHYLYSSCPNTGELFRPLFPDSRIAAKFSCEETECAYVSICCQRGGQAGWSYGIARWSKSLNIAPYDCYIGLPILNYLNKVMEMG